MINNIYDEEKEGFLYKEAQLLIENLNDELIGDNKTLLYVGANCFRACLLDFLHGCNFKIDIVEIFHDNVECIKSKYKYNNLIQGSVLDDEVFKIKYDVLFWRHGPEHVKKEEFELFDKGLENKTNLIVLICPFNDIEQSTLYGNAFEQHVWPIFPKELEEMGYSVLQYERPPFNDNIIAWKKI